MEAKIVAGRAPSPLSREAGGVWAPARRPLTVGLVLAVTLVAFEALAIATVLPSVSRHLGDFRLYGWVFSAFLLSSLAGIVVAGAMADRTALTQPMAAGLALFAAGLVVGGTAVNMPVLVAGRALQGLGAGVVPATAYVAISRGYPDSCRPRMFAVLSTAWVVPGLVGPAIAAAVATAVGWRWVFLGLVPLVLCIGVMATRALRILPGPLRQDGERQHLPYLAVLGVVLGAAALLAALSAGSLLAVPGALVGGAFLVLSLRRLTPAGTLVARAGLPVTVLSRGLLTFCFFAGDAYVPYAVSGVRHAPAFLAGLVLTAATVTWAVGSWVQARTLHRVGPRRLVRIGEALVLCGLGLMFVALLPAVPPAVAIGSWAVAGLGMGTAYSPLSVTTLNLAPVGQEGRVTSGLQLTDVLGQALGAGTAGAVVAMSTHAAGARTGVALAFLLGIAVGMVGLVVTRRLPGHLRSDVPA